MGKNPRNYYPDPKEDDEYGQRGMYKKTTEKFHVGQCYTSKPAKKLRCKICRGDKFEVGTDDYFTAIRCPDCGWEECVHDG